MSEPNYTVKKDQEHKLLRMTLAGLWDRETFDGFEKEVRRVVDTLGSAAAKAEYGTLADARAFVVQSPEVAERFQSLAGDDSIMLGRLAMIQPGALATMQHRRMAPGQRRRVFGSEVEAIAWLLAPDDRC
jgi:hypothetical protein